MLNYSLPLYRLTLLASSASFSRPPPAEGAPASGLHALLGPSPSSQRNTPSVPRLMPIYLLPLLQCLTVRMTSADDDRPTDGSYPSAEKFQFEQK